MNDENTILSTHLISFAGDDSKLLSDPETSSIKPRPSSSGTSVFKALDQCIVEVIVKFKVDLIWAKQHRDQRNFKSKQGI